MSTAVSLPVIELESQIHVLNRLQFLTRFSSNLIQVTGPQGAGKSFLAQHYLSHWAQDSHQAYLICHTQQQDAQHRAILIDQLFKGAVFNEQDTLSQSIQHLLGDSASNILIVIDDADLLSPAMIGDLWALVQDASRLKHLQVNVLLFALEGRLDNYLSKVSHGQGSTPIEVELNPLQDAEVQQFVDILIAHLRLDANQRRDIRTQLEVTPPWPGALAALQHQEADDMAKKANRTIPILAAIFVVLTLIGAGLIFYFFPASGSREPEVISVMDEDTDVDFETAIQSPPGVQEDLPSIETGPFEVPAGFESSVSAAENVANLSGAQSAESQSAEMTDSRVTDDDRMLPQEVITDGLTVGRLDERERVVVPGEVVDSIITEQEAGGDGSVAMSEQPELAAVVENILDSSVSEAAPMNDTPVVTTETATPSAEVTIREPEDTATVTTPPPSSASSRPGTELKQIAANRYALQLAAVRSQAAAQQFIQEVEMAGQASIYQTVRNGGDWYIVVTGSYPSIEAARRAEFSLPAKAQEVQPWVKSYRQIHLEIDRAN
ncbi:SPOR domain-containing protein [Thaumasiovibrio subtropicus]|uniref:SPOR domain-containing protein n=1 Tax=Thaumasiovibrio subtropicus TaxID=1891207 RepID=UPI000B35EE12|nr:SPOR domain-containing protein [Thaumasiovibrio subtropicus]